MGEREQRIAADMMGAANAYEAEVILFTNAESADPDEVIQELRAQQRELEAYGRVKAASIADFYVSLVHELSPRLRKVSSRRSNYGDQRNPRHHSEGSQGELLLIEQTALELLERGEFDVARNVIAHALELVDPESYRAGRIIGLQWRLAEAISAVGRNREALQILDSLDLGSESDSVEEAGIDGFIRIRYHTLRGDLYRTEAEYERARLEYVRALNHAKILGDRDAEFALRMASADTYLAAGRAREAVREFSRVLRLAESRGGTKIRAVALNRLGAAYRKAGEHAAARSCYRRTLELTDDSDVTQPTRMDAVEAWVGLGDLAADEGQSRDAAEAYFEALTMSVVNNTDAIAYGMGLVVSRLDCISARDAALLLKTAQIFRDGLGFNPERRWSWSFHLPFRLGETVQWLSDGHVTEAVSELRVLRDEALLQTGDVVTRLMIDDRLVQALRIRGLPTDQQEAFDIAWQARSTLLDTLNRRPHGEVLDRPALMEQHRASYEVLVRLLVEFGAEIAVPADSRLDPGEGKANALELAFDLHEEFKTWADNMSNGEIADAPATLRILREYVKTDADAENCAFVSYLCGTRSTIIFVVHADSGRLSAVCTDLTSSTLQLAAERLRRTFDGDADAFPPMPPLPARRPWRRSLGFFQELAPELLPFLPEVAGRELLCVAADQAIQALPLSALPIPAQDGRRQESGQVLASRHAVVQVTSATALLRTTAMPPSRNTDVFVAGVAAREDTDTDRLETDAEFVAGGGQRIAVHGATGLEATPDSVLSGLRTARIAHLSGHGWYDRVEPLSSGLFLAYAGQRPTKFPLTVEVRTRLRHLLTARRLVEAELRLDMVALRACSTARKDSRSIGDIQGLAQLLQSSGARTVVATLWDVDDASSRRLFSDFYQRLAEGSAEPPWRALWQAQQRMLERPAAPWENHPYHWAALALFGDWRLR